MGYLEHSGLLKFSTQPFLFLQEESLSNARKNQESQGSNAKETAIIITEYLKCFQNNGIPLAQHAQFLLSLNKRLTNYSQTWMKAQPLWLRVSAWFGIKEKDEKIIDQLANQILRQVKQYTEQVKQIESFVAVCRSLTAKTVGKLSRMKLNLFTMKILESTPITIPSLQRTPKTNAFLSILEDLIFYKAKLSDIQSIEKIESVFKEIQFAYEISLLLFGVSGEINELDKLKESYSHSYFINHSVLLNEIANRILFRMHFLSPFNSLVRNSYMVIPGGYFRGKLSSKNNAQNKGHTVLYLIEKEKNYTRDNRTPTFSFTVINCGEGAVFDWDPEVQKTLDHLKQERLSIQHTTKNLQQKIKELDCPYNELRLALAQSDVLIQRLQQLMSEEERMKSSFSQFPIIDVQFCQLTYRELSQDFFKKIMAFQIPEQGASNMEEVNQFIEQSLFHPEHPNKKLTRKHRAQYKESCTIKSILAVLHDRIDQPLYQEFKVDMTKRELEELQRTISSMDSDTLSNLTGTEFKGAISIHLSGKILLQRMQELGQEIYKKRQLKLKDLQSRGSSTPQSE